ncbi:MAG: DPP IV N-terminal domain-containing protein, partial [Aureibaculum sp.]|nr:DPP IV N-terminal domain-containing protein [Aureibaculum sp.]
MKKYLFIPLLLFVFLASAQETKHLTLEDAVLGYYKGLYPAQKSLQWVTNSNTYSYLEDSKLFIESATALDIETKIPVLHLKEIQKTVPDLKRMPSSFLEITTEYITFNHNHAIIKYNYKSKKVLEKIDYPNESENTDFNYKAHAVAYTIDNNLYIATPKDSKISVTNSQDKNIVSGQAIARSEFGIRKGIFW